MGMCSRQERIQKDIDVVIQRSRADKDCLFAGELPGPPRARPPRPCPRPLPVPTAARAPDSGFVWQQLLRREREPAGEGVPAAPLSPPPPPQVRAARSFGAGAGARAGGGGASLYCGSPRARPDCPSCSGFQRQPRPT